MLDRFAGMVSRHHMAEADASPRRRLDIWALMALKQLKFSDEYNSEPPTEAGLQRSSSGSAMRPRVFFGFELWFRAAQ